MKRYWIPQGRHPTRSRGQPRRPTLWPPAQPTAICQRCPGGSGVLLPTPKVSSGFQDDTTIYQHKFSYDTIEHSSLNAKNAIKTPRSCLDNYSSI